MSFFYGIPSLEAVTNISGTTSNTIIFNGSVSLNNVFDVTGTGTFLADQNIFTGIFLNFGDLQETRIGFDGTFFLIDPLVGGSGAKVFIGDGTNKGNLICNDIDANYIGGITIAGTNGNFTKISALQGTLGTNVVQISTTATNDDPTVYWQQGRIATTDATVTTLDTVTTSNDTCIMVESMIVARRTGGVAGTAGDIASYKRIAAFKNVAGVLTQVGTTTDASTFESQAGWDATYAVSGTSILVRVTGAVSNNVTWHSTTQVFKVGT